MNRTQKFLRNSFSTAVWQLAVMAVGFVTPKIMLTYYGSEINGLVSSILQFITYFNLAEAGISGAAIFALYKPLAEKDQASINGVVAAAKKYYFQAGYLFMALLLGLAVVYPFFVKTEAITPVTVGVLCAVLGARGFLEFFALAKYRVLLTADQKTYVISWASTAYVLLNMAIIYFAATAGAQVLTVYVLALGALLIRSLILAVYVQRCYKGINYRWKPDKAALNKRWDVLFQSVLQAVQQGTPVILATIFTDLKWVSVYTIYNMVTNGINQVLMMFTSGLSASFGDVIARGQTKTLQNTYSQFEFAYYTLIAFVYAVAFVMIMPFIRVYTAGITDTSYDVPLIGFLFVLNGLLYNLKTPQGMLVISAGLYREVRGRNIIQSAIIIVAGVILAPQYGLAGILAAMCLSNLYRDIDLLFFIPKYVTKLPVRWTLWRWARLTVIMAAVYTVFNWITIDAHNYLEWAIWAVWAASVTLAVAAAFSFAFEREQMRAIANRLRKTLKFGGNPIDSKLDNASQR